MAGLRQSPPASFSFQGHQVRDLSTMDDFARAVATHPRLPTAWVQKLCMWANSQRCDEADPEFVRVASLFRDGYDAASPRDDFRFMTLVRELFASPLVTGARRSSTHDSREFLVSVTRYNHFCEATRTRLQDAADARCEAEGRAPGSCRSRHVPNCVVDRGLAGFRPALALGKDSLTRGQTDLQTPFLEDPMFTVAVHQACNSVTDNATRPDGPFPRDKPQASIEGMVRFLMGLPASHPRHTAAVAALTRTFGILTARGTCPGGATPLVANQAVPAGGTFVCGEGLSADTAMRHLFQIACSSPDVVGVGF